MYEFVNSSLVQQSDLLVVQPYIIYSLVSVIMVISIGVALHLYFMKRSASKKLKISDPLPDLQCPYTLIGNLD